jgi:hypothetical protein
MRNDARLSRIEETIAARTPPTAEENRRYWESLSDFERNRRLLYYFSLIRSACEGNELALKELGNPDKEKIKWYRSIVANFPLEE